MKKQNYQDVIYKGNIGLGGGGSACAFTGGVLQELLNHPTVEFNRVSGTSGGALMGAVLAQAINKFGYSHEGREAAQTRISEFWDSVCSPISARTEDILQIIPFMNPYTQTLMRNAASAMDRVVSYDALSQMGQAMAPALNGNPAYEMIKSHARGQYTHAIERHLNRTTLNPNALQKASPIHLTVNAVDSQGNQKLFSGKALNTQSLMATGALPGVFHAVNIDGTNYWDGACLGGANPSIPPLLSGKPDFLMFVMTSPPESPIYLQKQSELTPDDVVDTDGLIIHQSYNEIASLLHRREAGDSSIPPIHIIYPDELKRPWTPEEKQLIDQSVKDGRIAMGQRATQAFMTTHKDTLHQKSSITLKELQKRALTNYHRSLAIAA